MEIYKKNDQLLSDLGWTPVHFWEKQIKKDLDGCVNQIIDIMQVKFAEKVDLFEQK